MRYGACPLSTEFGAGALIRGQGLLDVSRRPYNKINPVIDLSVTEQKLIVVIP